MSNDDLARLLNGLNPDQIADLIADLPEPAARALLEVLPASGEALPQSPLAQALELDDGYSVRPHLQYLSDRLAKAVRDVEAGIDRKVAISMPPRSGKSMLSSQYLPLWLLRRHPEWKIGMISHDSSLSTAWGRFVRRYAENHPELGITIASDAGAVQNWETTSGGGIVSRSVGGGITGKGFKVALLDDLVKDAVAAHSEIQRQSVWEWYTSTLTPRLEPPSLVLAIGTRWHEDDFIGRLLSAEHDGDPDEWEVISFPAIAEDDADVLGRAPGEPLLSPLLDETHADALDRWDSVKRSVGGYVWSALYQQAPAPSKGAIFDMSWWRYWTTDISKVRDDGSVVYFDPEPNSGDTWVESWDMAFKGSETSDFVVGQRWVRRGPNRFLTAQVRGRWSFTESIAQMRAFSAAHVPTRLVEDKANGTAVIDTLRREVDGLVPINPKDGKEVRARSNTPTLEAGNVLLPLPSDLGNEWVSDLLTEARNFPQGAHDDQVDAMNQALTRLQHANVRSIGRPTSQKMPTRARSGSLLTSKRIAR